VTLDHLCQMVKDGVDFVVTSQDRRDITRSVKLTQIIVEEEGQRRPQTMRRVQLLRTMI